ncbi:PREDICTED: macrodontain-1-like [Tarenaya hassleriana]|uniref:macrodontain-1-like n=1 Tax=Tarenaya hassleriana TaxID=28532 RepID=UPI00053C9E0B|nr:PREDICTED: macrodontain-1-like [Tarenaya hassleriana]
MLIASSRVLLVLVVQETGGHFRGTNVWKLPTGVVNQTTDGTGGKKKKQESGKDKEKDAQKPAKEGGNPNPQGHSSGKDKGQGGTGSGDDDDEEEKWDWRSHYGIVGDIIDQGEEAVCWAFAIVRVVEALYNIGQTLYLRKYFSIQHLVNEVPYEKTGILNCKRAFDHVIKHGLIQEEKCKFVGKKFVCKHNTNFNRTTVDNFVTVHNVDDTELLLLVRRQPIVGILDLTDELQDYTTGLYRGSGSTPNRGTHAVVIVGFGVENGQAYWLVACSWGKQWGNQGFGRIARRTVQGQRSVFKSFHFPEKKDYPKE